jgi:hypothetical protein
VGWAKGAWGVPPEFSAKGWGVPIDLLNLLQQCSFCALFGDKINKFWANFGNIDNLFTLKGN